MTKCINHCTIKRTTWLLSIHYTRDILLYKLCKNSKVARSWMNGNNDLFVFESMQKRV